MAETHQQNRRFGDARVSTYGQTLDAQLEQLAGGRGGGSRGRLAGQLTSMDSGVAQPGWARPALIARTVQTANSTLRIASFLLPAPNSIAPFELSDGERATRHRRQRQLYRLYHRVAAQSPIVVSPSSSAATTQTHLAIGYGSGFGSNAIALGSRRRRAAGWGGAGGELGFGSQSGEAVFGGGEGEALVIGNGALELGSGARGTRRCENRCWPSARFLR